uniref:Uncharacterized protein n=1 Tax=Acrobeloides nanus TaxID=290746 RepID=A0A914E875_9BILA
MEGNNPNLPHFLGNALADIKFNKQGNMTFTAQNTAQAREKNQSQRPKEENAKTDEQHDAFKWYWMSCIFALLITMYLHNSWRTTEIPDHLIGHTSRFYPEFITEETRIELVELVKSMQIFKTLNKDTVPVNRTYKNVGEAMPILEDGTCSEPFFIPTLDGTQCILPGRYEMNRHWMKYGGLEGLKETYEELTSRIKFFMYARYVFDIKNHPVVKSLFYSEKFIKAAKEICPAHKQVLDPYQFIFILQVPGQTIPIHLDPPYFDRTSRYHIPEWLLIVMIGSGLFKDQMHDHVQGVAYLHEWNTSQNAGNFAYFDKNKIVPSYISPNPRAVMLMDGSKTMHAAALYKTEV